MVSTIMIGVLLGLGFWLTVLGIRGKRVINININEATNFFSSENLRRILIGLVLGLGVWLVTGIFVAGLLLGVGVGVFRGRLGSKRTTFKLTEKSEAIASWTEMLHSIFLAGGGIEKAIASSADIAPRPIRLEVQKLASRLENRPIQDALFLFSQEMKHPASDKIVAVLTLSALKGATHIAELLCSQAESIRADSRVILEFEAGRSRHRTSATIVMGATLAVATGLYFFEAGYLDPYRSFPGYFVLLVVGLGFMLGFGMLIRMGAIGEPERYFEIKENLI